MSHRCAILDDYQNVALKMAGWSRCADQLDVTVFDAPLGGPDKVVEALSGFDIVCVMRERTPFPREVIERLPDLRLITTMGMRNAAIDVAAAKERGVVVSGTQSAAYPTVELTFAHLLEFTRRVGRDNARLKSGAPWQEGLGGDLHGKTLGVIGLGRLGSQVAKIATAFGMHVIAWSQNLAPGRCAEIGVGYVSKEELLRTADFVTIHLQLSARTRGLIAAPEFALMKPSAVLINTSRGPIVDEAALVTALETKRIRGAALDVYDVEPLPLDHPLRRLENAQLTPHTGYVTRDNYRLGYSAMLENIEAFIDGAPIRVIEP